MNIVQIFSNYTGSGQTAYVIEFNRTLKELGHNVKVFKFSTNKNLNAGNAFDMNDLNVQQRFFNELTYKEINEADLVCINGLTHKKEDEDYKELFYDMIEKKITAKKVLFMHSHLSRSFLAANYGKRFMTKEFLLSFHKILMFDKKTEMYLKIQQVIGEEEVEKRYVHLQHPYHFDDSKKLWMDPSKKYKKVSFFGRCCAIKDPTRLIDMSPYLFRYNWQVELRGIERSIAVINFKNLIYEWDEKNNKPTNIHSTKTQFVDKAFRLKYNLPKKDDYCDDFIYDGNKVLVYRRYDKLRGMQTMASQAFCVDFYNLKNNAYGNTIEYAICDFVNCGTIPVLDYDMGSLVHTYVNGYPTDQTLVDAKAGIFVKKDLSNIDEVVEQMNYLYDNPDEYEKMRQNCYEIYKNYSDPIGTIKRFIKECK